MSALLLALLAWYACGIVSFLCWWSDDCEVDGWALFDSLIFGIMGPLNLLTGYLVHRLMGDKNRAEAEADWSAAGINLRSRVFGGGEVPQRRCRHHGGAAVALRGNDDPVE